MKGISQIIKSVYIQKLLPGKYFTHSENLYFPNFSYTGLLLAFHKQESFDTTEHFGIVKNVFLDEQFFMFTLNVLLEMYC